MDRMKQFFSKKPSTQDVSAGSEFNEEAELINNLDYQQYMIQNHLKYLMKSQQQKKKSKKYKTLEIREKLQMFQQTQN